MTVRDVERAREKTAFTPGNLILSPALTELRITVATQANENLFEEISARRQRLARGNFKDHAVHVNVAGKVQIDAAPFDLGPRVNFLRSGVENRVAFDLRDLTFFQPVTIKIALDPTATTNVRRAEFLLSLR